MQAVYEQECLDSNNTLFSNRKLWYCLSASFVLHAAAFIYISEKYTNHRTPSVTEKPVVINIDIQTNSVKTESSATKQSQAHSNNTTSEDTIVELKPESINKTVAAHTTPAKTETTNPIKSITETQSEKIPEKISTPEFNYSEQISRAVELEQSASTDNLTFRQFNSCTDQERKSGVVNCSDFSNLAIQPELDRLPINSKHLIVKNFELNQVDFKKRVQLIEHLSLIESLSNNPSIDKSVLIEHRRKLTQEINSIDDQQTRFGLLKIPIIAGQIIAHELKQEGHYDSAKNRPKLIIDHKEESSQEAITAPGADRQNTDSPNNPVDTPANTPVSVPARPDSP
ncbi:hypothetical protein [Sessilibacter corallicola]|uniref:Uncharacterized protein n=1 Tax=Sessilibacter corallicola TaxID=2904075 RepID=A0ABQ0A600_9GAMM